MDHLKGRILAEALHLRSAFDAAPAARRGSGVLPRSGLRDAFLGSVAESRPRSPAGLAAGLLQRQHNRKPCRYHRITVSGRTRTSASRQPGQQRDSHAQKIRSEVRNDRIRRNSPLRDTKWRRNHRNMSLEAVFGCLGVRRLRAAHSSIRPWHSGPNDLLPMHGHAESRLARGLLQLAPATIGACGPDGRRSRRRDESEQGAPAAPRPAPRNDCPAGWER